MDERRVRMYRQMGLSNADIDRALRRDFPGMDPRQFGGSKSATGRRRG